VIPFLDLKSTYLELKTEIDSAIYRHLDSGWYILGPEVKKFEESFAAFCNASYCVGVGNGLDALILGLRSLDIGPGHEVIVPSNTYIATWLAVSAVGAIPVPVDPDPETHCLDPLRVEQAITTRTVALLAVHLYGHPAPIQELLVLCKRYGLKMVEDAAQAHGARFGNQCVGSSSDIVAWSFYPGKNLGAFGDAGAITTNSKILAERISTLRNYGSAIKYLNKEKGVNSRLDPIQAAVLSAKLPKLVEWNLRRTRISELYSARLQNLPIGIPRQHGQVTHAWHLYVITTSCREALQSHLANLGVGTLVHYPVPPFKQEAYKELSHRHGEWPIAVNLASQVLSLPIGPHLTIDQASYVADSIESFFLSKK